MIKELASGYVVGIGTNWYMSKLESLALSESLGREATALNLLVKRDEVELLSRLKVYYLDAIIKNLISPLSRSSPRP
jgi:hypothetical protein